MSSVGAEENNVTVLPHVVLRQKKSSNLNKVQKLKRRISDSLGRLSSFSSRKSKAHNHDLNTDDHQWHNADDLATPDSDANFLQSWERLHLSEGDGLDRKGSVTRALSVASDSRLLDIQSSHDRSFKVSSPRDGTPESLTPGKSSNKSRDGATKSGGDSGFGSGTGSLADLLSSVVRRSKKSRVPRPFSEACLAPVQPPSLLQTTDEPLERKERRRSKRYSAYGIDSVYGREDAYVRLEQLGEGSYATVFKGISNLTGQEVALKEIRLQEEEGAPFTAIREASLLRDLRHSNIVTLHDIVHTKTSLTLVFEYVAGDLAQYLERHPGGLVANNVRLLLFQLLRGLAYCHHRKILHRDLKPQNLLLSLNGELKLADFGLARAQSVPSHTYSPEVVTLWYRPPDVLLGTTNYTATLDIWGAGCVFVETLTGHPAFPGAKDSFDQLDKIFQVLGTPTEATWHGISQLPNYKPAKLAFHRAHRLGRAFPRLYDVAHAEALAIKLLQLRPEARPSARDAMRHEFFSSLPPEVFSLSDRVRPCDISRQLLVSHGCVSKILTRFYETGSVKPGAFGGVKGKNGTTPSLVRKVLRLKAENPSLFPPDIREVLLSQGHCDQKQVPAISTIERILKNADTVRTELLPDNPSTSGVPSNPLLPYRLPQPFLFHPFLGHHPRMMLFCQPNFITQSSELPVSLISNNPNSVSEGGEKSDKCEVRQKKKKSFNMEDLLRKEDNDSDAGARNGILEKGITFRSGANHIGNVQSGFEET